MINAYGTDVNVRVLTTRYGQETDLLVSGRPAAVDAWWEHYKRDYAPEGYGTSRQIVINTDDHKAISTSRYYSCD